MENIDGLIDCLLDIKIGNKSEKDFIDLLGINPPQQKMTLQHDRNKSVEEILHSFTGSDRVVGDSTLAFIEIVKAVITSSTHTEAIEIIYNSIDKLQASIMFGLILPKWEVFSGLNQVSNIASNFDVFNILIQYHSHQIMMSSTIPLEDLGVYEYDTDEDGMLKAWSVVSNSNPHLRGLSLHEAYELIIGIIGDFGLPHRILRARMIANEKATSSGVDLESAAGMKILTYEITKHLVELDIEMRVLRAKHKA